VLDALVAEARLRWGLDLGAGLQVVAAERLRATPLEPSRPALIVPSSVLRLEPIAGADGEALPSPDPSGPSGLLPGRHGHPADDPLATLRRLYPADHPVGRFGAAAATTLADLTDASLAAPLYLGPVAPERAVASPWAMPWISHRLRLPDGCPWDREQTHESLRNHLLEEA
jgi:tetrapyrrole methylase family protein/MazG family protein